MSVASVCSAVGMLLSLSMLCVMTCMYLSCWKCCSLVTVAVLLMVGYGVA